MASNELIPRSYLDNLINIALPAIAGYMPGTVSNLHKNITKSNGNLTQASAVTPPNKDGNLYYIYPFINTPVSSIVTYTGSTNAMSSGVGYVGMGLVEFQSLTATSGEVVAATGDRSGTNLWINTNTRYTNTLIPSYTLKAGFKYAIAIVHNNSTTVSLLGFGMGNAPYSVGTLPNDVQTSTIYGGTGAVPAVGNIITASAAGSGFAVSIVLEP